MRKEKNEKTNFATRAMKILVPKLLAADRD
jgi:hypothetical protein